MLSSCRVLPLVCLMVSAGCGDGMNRTAIKADPDAAAAEAMTLYDANSDGLLDASELEQSPPLAAAASRIDSNRDGKISADEIAARLQQYDQLSSYVVGEVTLTRGGRPLLDAELTFAPEPFLGEDFPTYVGKSGSYGIVRFQPQSPPTPGIAAGFYRVTIKTTDGEESVRGLEMANDVPSISRLEIAL